MNERVIKVAYVSDLNLPRNYIDMANSIIDECTSNQVRYLILNGGISSNYKVTISFIDYLRQQLHNENISVRFTVGNTDYYAPNDSVVDKTDHYNKVRSLFHNHPSCLVTHPIITQDIWLIGADTWYDYSLYRGKPIRLKDITKKSKWFIKANKDNTYITDKEDYRLGLENTFDKKSTLQCINSLRNTIDRYLSRVHKPLHLIVCGYFYPNSIYLGNGALDDYFGSFKGSRYFDPVMTSRGVTEYVAGLTSKKYNMTTIGNTRYRNSNNKLQIIEYPY